MRYAPKDIAKALAKAVIETPRLKEDALVANFEKLIRREGLGGKKHKILEEAERIIMRHEGRRDVLVETPRPLDECHRTALQKKVASKDRLRANIKPELVAGMKITIDGEEVLDNTLKRKLERLFSS